MTRLLSRVPASTVLALSITVPAALIAAVLIGHDAFLARQRLTQEGIRYGQTLGEPLLNASQRALREDSFGAVQEMFEDAGRSRWVKHLVLVGRDGRVVASSRRDWIGREESVIGAAERGETVAVARSSRKAQHRLVDDNQRLVLVWPLPPGGPGLNLSRGDRGLLDVEIDLDGRRRELSVNVLRRGVFSVLGVLGLSVCVHLCVRAILTRRIQEAAAYARAVASGEAAMPPRVAGPREVAQLIQHVGRIGSDLRDREAKLRVMEEQLLEARRKESAASLASAVAHDLNNMLTGILGYARLALDRVGPGDPIRRQLATIENSATRAADLTGRLLNLGPPAAGPAALDGSMAPPNPGEVRAAAIAPVPEGASAALPLREEQSATILAVDDESTVLALAKDVLELHGYNVLTARNGEEALRVFRAHRDEIDLVLLDLTMPVMGGRQCFRELRRIDPGVRVVISSGFSSESSASDVLGEGAIAFLQKPYDIDCLARTVGAALNGPAPSAAAGAAG